MKSKTKKAIIPDYEMSIWLVDWKYKDSIKEVNQAINGVDNALLFTTYFDYANKLYQTEESAKLITGVFSDKNIIKKKIYLTIINDQFLQDGRIIQKNPNVLETLLNDPVAKKKHIEEIIYQATKYPYYGVELDYEKIPNNLVESYITFLKELKIELAKKKLDLRVVLEPRFPIDKYTLPKDIRYTVMAYNLYGYHSGPGPKADYSFLDSLTKKFSNKDGNMGVALATGGFSWRDGKVTALTEKQAFQIVQDNKIVTKRDDKSGALYFEYMENEKATTVWYADAKTLELWMKYLNEKGKYNSFSIWRTGGLTDSTLQFLNKQ